MSELIQRIRKYLAICAPHVKEREGHRLLAEALRALEAQRELALLLKDRHEFPEFPRPGEGMVSDAEDQKEQAEWHGRYTKLDRRIRKALAAALGRT